LRGKDTIDLEIPESVVLLKGRKEVALPDPSGAVYNGFSNPIGSNTLKEVAKGRKNACMVILDITRPVPTQIILPPIFKPLKKAELDYNTRGRYPCCPRKAPIEPGR